MNTTSQTHDDGLEWLREVRSRMLMNASGDFKKLGDRYCAVESQHPEKTFYPHAVAITAVKTQRGSHR